jgi:hypothetical protein
VLAPLRRGFARKVHLYPTTTILGLLPIFLAGSLDVRSRCEPNGSSVVEWASELLGLIAGCDGLTGFPEAAARLVMS